jgi:NTE family protein
MEDIAAFLAKTVLFSVLPPAALPQIARAATRVALAKGEALFEAGTPGDAVYVVRSGLLQITTAASLDGQGGQALGEVARGEHVGEMAVLTGEPRAASAVAVVESVLYALPGALVRELFQTHPILWARLSLGLMRNLQTQWRRGARGVRTCALVGAGTGATRSLALTLALAEELASLAGEPIAVLDCVPVTAAPAPAEAALPDPLSEVTQTLRRLVRPALGSEHPNVTVVRLGSDCSADSPVADLVAELRRRHARVLVHATVPWTAVAGRGIAQCDALRWVVDADDASAAAVTASAFTELGALVRNPAVPSVLAFASGAAPSAGNGSVPHQTIPVPATADAIADLATAPARRVLRAVARELADRRTALVLGAGGAKGFAHVGALRVFERHGIEFDAVAGTSIGAIVGALVAMGWSAETVEALFMGVASNPWKTLFDLRVPTEAFFRSKKKSELIAEYCAGMQIERMNLPFFAVAGDLTALAPVVFSSGPLDLALDASSAIPTVFRPVRHDDRMLVDGWVCDPLPAGVVRAAGFERVIAIDLSPRGRPTSRRASATAAVAPPGLGGRLRILAIAMRAMELASQEHVARSLPLIDVLVRPDLDGFSSADLDGAAEMCARGEAAAEAAIPAIREGTGVSDGH